MGKPAAKKNIILFVSNSPSLWGVVGDFKKRYGKEYRIALIYQKKADTKEKKEFLKTYDIAIRCNFNSPTSITKAIKPHERELLAITAKGDANIPYLQRIIPHVPYLRTPTTESLDWSTNKLKMRRRFMAYDKSITPLYKVANDSRKKTIKEIEEKIGFPLVIKPIGLASSLLVTIAYHHEELEKSLRRIMRRINRIHKENNGRAEPEVLVEQFMEGDMYSVDVHVGSRGGILFNPFVYVKTGKIVGFDDFFAYQTITPTLLNKESVKEAQKVSVQAIRALGLRSTSAHIELLKTEKGWKVIEVGPRVGGFRDKMYRLSYDINLTLNDIKIRIPQKFTIPKRAKGYTAVIKVYAKKEGLITAIAGVKKSQLLKSFHSIKINKKVGDRAVFAKHGGKDIFNITFFNKDRSGLLADIRRFEQMLKVETE